MLEIHSFSIGHQGCDRAIALNLAVKFLWFKNILGESSENASVIGDAKGYCRRVRSLSSGYPLKCLG